MVRASHGWSSPSWSHLHNLIGIILRHPQASQDEVSGRTFQHHECNRFLMEAPMWSFTVGEVMMDVMVCTVNSLELCFLLRLSFWSNWWVMSWWSVDESLRWNSLGVMIFTGVRVSGVVKGGSCIVLTDRRGGLAVGSYMAISPTIQTDLV